MSETSMKRHMGLKASRTLANTLIYILQHDTEERNQPDDTDRDQQDVDRRVAQAP